jgi:hypothetical protein
MKKWMMRIVGISMLLGAGLAQAALVTTTTYTNTGSSALIDVVYNNTAGTKGSIDSTNSNYWSSGLPSDSNPGAFTNGTAQTASGINAWYGVAVRQTGGQLSDTSLAMRGGDEVGSSTQCILEIDDASNTNFAYANLAISGQLTLWPQFGAGNTNTFSVLNGYADVGIVAGTTPGQSFVNILDGRLDVGYLSNARFNVNMMNGGTGQFILDDMYGDSADPDHKSKLKNMILNFETGSEASFTILASNVAGNAQGAWETKIAAGQVKIDGGAVTVVDAFVIEDVGATGTKISLFDSSGSSTMVTTTTFDGSGITSDVLNWDNGLPSNANPGLINQTTSTSWLGGGWYSVSVKQTGGEVIVIGANNFAMRGGTAGTTDGSTFDIDDVWNRSFSYTNMAFNNQFTMWNSNSGDGGTGNTLSVLNGYATIDLLSTTENNPADARINILNGKLDIASLKSASCTVKMLAGGTGEVNLTDMIGTNATTGALLLDSMVLNFEPGSAASFTIASSNVTGSAQGYWETKIAASKVKIDGAVATAGQFQITDVGALGTTIMLFDLASATPTEIYDAWIGGYGVSDPAMDADPDGDQYDNLFEYGVGGNPDDAGVNGNIPETSTVEETGTNWFYYVHYERTDKDDVGLSYALEAGSDLVNTNWGSVTIEPVGNGAGPAGYNVFTNRVSTETLGAQFIKLDIGFTE